MPVCVNPKGVLDENNTSCSGEFETGVTVDEIEALLEAAEIINWEDAPRLIMLMWAEDVTFLLQRLVGEPVQNVIGVKNATS